MEIEPKKLKTELKPKISELEALLSGAGISPDDLQNTQ